MLLFNCYLEKAMRLNLGAKVGLICLITKKSKNKYRRIGQSFKKWEESYKRLRGF
jgi:hypothetical protein